MSLSKQYKRGENFPWIEGENGMTLFRELDETDTESFKQWARDNYSPGEEISGVWHPVVQKECVKINEEVLG